MCGLKADIWSNVTINIFKGNFERNFGGSKCILVLCTNIVNPQHAP